MRHLALLAALAVAWPRPAPAAAGSPADQEVLRCAEVGDAAALREALRQGGSPDATAFGSGSALLLAVQRDAVEAARVLLEAGAGGLGDLHGLRPTRLLTLAAWGGSPAMVRLLLEKGADPAALEPDGTDALAGAVARGSVVIVTALLDAGADPSRRLDGGLTAVARAALHGRPEILALLLDRKGDPERRDDEGNTPLILAAAQAREEALRLLLARGVRPWPSNARQRTALGEARAIRDPEARARTVALLRGAGARDGEAPRRIDAAYLAAAQRGDLARVKEALRRGADPEARGTLVKGAWIRDALHAAVAHPEVVRHLLEIGVNPRMVDAGGFTALHAAASDGAPEVIDLLLARGLDPDTPSQRGFTPLFQAMDGRPRPAAVARLLAGGADPAGRTATGEPLLDYARKERQAQVVRLLEAAIRERAVAAQARADPALLGCWRSQAQVHRLADGQARATNSGCALEILPAEVRRRCPGSDRVSTSTYRLDRPGHWEARPAQAGSPRRPGPAHHAAYRVEERWLELVAEPPPGRAGDPARPVRIESVLLRAPAAAGGCAPPPPSPLRVTTGAPSSVALAAPPGWAPLLEEPAGLPHVQEAMGTGLLVAMLVPAGEVEVAARSLARASAFVLVVDDTRSGAAPVRPADVPALKARLRAERAAMPVSCDGPSTICFDLPTEAAAGAERARVATAYVAVAGRLVVVHATAVGTSHEAPRRALAAVTEQLLALDR